MLKDLLMGFIALVISLLLVPFVAKLAGENWSSG